MYLTVVYASNLFSNKQLLWHELSQLACAIDKACLLLGDINNVLNPKDKKGGPPVPFSHFRGFSNFLLSCSFTEINIQSFQFTRRRRGIATHIDKVLINNTLLQHFLILIATSTLISDHTLSSLNYIHHRARKGVYPSNIVIVGTWLMDMKISWYQFYHILHGVLQFNSSGSS